MVKLKREISWYYWEIFRISIADKGNFVFSYRKHQGQKMKNEVIDFMRDGVGGMQTDRLGRDIVLIENPTSREGCDFPFSSNTLICIVMRTGEMNCVVNMEEHEISKKGMLLIHPGQIVERIFFSEDFMGYFILFSNRFLDRLDVQNSIGVLRTSREQVMFRLEDEGVEALSLFFRMMQALIRSDNPYKMEAALHLTLSYFYGLGTYFHSSSASETKSRQEEISAGFLSLVRDNCRERRNLDFYADRLSISIKHLSKVVTETTGTPPIKWIERYTILHAKSLLKTSSYPIGQISDILSFGSQSDFGKYFKKYAGLSPAAYRKQG